MFVVQYSYTKTDAKPIAAPTPAIPVKTDANVLPWISGGIKTRVVNKPVPFIC